MKTNGKDDREDQSKGNLLIDEVMTAEMGTNGVMVEMGMSGGKVCDDAVSETQGLLSVDKVIGVSNVLHGKWSRVRTEHSILYDEQLQEEERKKLNKQNKK